ncbi:MAG TPA: Grx4 family monothiol glutaredoxin [Candidatus Kapabacteria bacterium]|nr:Grx4 family monothiol glutaredoxin [Candidatus Kapabacteria bacterium]
MTTSNTEAVIRQQIATNPVLLYMKGTPDAPECGFSGATVAALKRSAVPFSFVNVLASPFIRERLPSISRWPTFPQLFVDGELIGGCDIVLGMEADGSLKPLLDGAGKSAAVAKAAE